MPGLHFIFSSSGGLGTEEDRIRESLDSLMHYDEYEREVLLSDDHLCLCCTKHQKYPIEVFENDRHYICLEGMLYGMDRSRTGAALNELARILFSDARDRNEQVARWLLRTDGDFVIFLQDEATNEACIINDALGRLPLYFMRDGKKVFVSRELRFITNLSSTKRFDRAGVAQYLLFGYPLGERTLLQDTVRLKPASLIRFGPGGKVTRTIAQRFDFEEKDEGKRDVRSYADACAELFVQACRNRVDAIDSNVITLSGGLDSRAVAIGLLKVGAPFSGATFLDYYGTAAPDIDTAKRVAEVLDFEWKLFPLGPTAGSDVLKLLRTKNGMNYLGMSFSIPYFHQIMAAYGKRITYFTGDGGDKILPDIRPIRRPRNIDALVKNIIASNQIAPLEVVCELAGIDRDEMVADVRDLLEAYPERDMRMKYVRFLIFERSYKWLFEGEDRNRFFFWTVTPFYSIEFFTYALRCPDQIKRNYRLYRSFLMNLSRKASEIIYVKWHLPVTSKKLPFYFLVKDMYSMMPLGLKKVIRSRYKKPVGAYALDSNLMKCFREQLSHCDGIADYLSLDALQKEAHRLDKVGFDHLFTVTSVIEDLLCGKSSIETYSEAGLI
jgi:asparagine synthase (glutamine-hydrolysing)